ncbi:MAG: YfhO family protein, partial [Chloroflexota bacterium]|nr:YfhO family protein [Chloroflexota bacterium]
GRLAFLTDRAGLMVLLFALATALVTWLSHPSPTSRGKGWGWGLALAFIAFDLFTINNPAYNAQPSERYPETPIVQTIQNDRDIFRVADEGKQPGHFGIAYGLEDIGGISPLRVARYDALLDLPPEKLWLLLNVRYVTTGRLGFANADVVMQDGDTRLLRLKDTLPRAWLVGAAQVADDQATLAAMKSDAFDPRAVAYVADALPFAPSPNAALTPVIFEAREPEHLVMSVNAPTDELLVLSEVYYPGWRATVDGVETPILRADVALRAVALRAGAHRVEMIFDPWSVKIGMAVTLGTVLALVILVSTLRFVV